MRSRNRKTAPRVRNGKVQKKNRTTLSPQFSLVEPGEPVIERRRPGRGFRHVLHKRDVERFLALLPDWDDLSRGLQAILLAEGDREVHGYHFPGVVAVCAWGRELECVYAEEFVAEHRSIFDRLGVPCEPMRGDDVRVHWTENSVRGFQLMHILLHELGHHHDRMTTRGQHRSSRGEQYAEDFANARAERLWSRYFDEFGW
ncbi:MAG: hypothetical protein AAGD14_01795 [Planctomycetota bacterium]